MWILYTVAFLAATTGLWVRATTVMGNQGRGWLFRNWIGGTIACFLGIVATLLASSDTAILSLIGFLLAVGFASAPWWGHLEQPKGVSAQPALAVAPSEAADASDDDHAIGTITFNYVDARGRESHRTVEVTAVDDEYFEGLCFTAGETRTFAIGRVQGKVMDVSTGQLLTAEQWATQARQHPLNGVVGMGGDWKHDDLDSDDENDLGTPPRRPVEILFTGFPKAQRQELEDLADLRGWKVVQSVTVGLTYLCTGPNAGPAKIEQAGDVGADIIDLGEFLDMSAGE